LLYLYRQASTIQSDSQELVLSSQPPSLQRNESYSSQVSRAVQSLRIAQSAQANRRGLESEEEIITSLEGYTLYLNGGCAICFFDAFKATNISNINNIPKHSPFDCPSYHHHCVKCYCIGHGLK
jgi:hypothetical protein